MRLWGTTTFWAGLICGIASILGLETAFTHAMSAIADAVLWAERIMAEIDKRWPNEKRS
jgi:hypothetical protein